MQLIETYKHALQQVKGSATALRLSFELVAAAASTLNEEQDRGLSAEQEDAHRHVVSELRSMLTRFPGFRHAVAEAIGVK